MTIDAQSVRAMKPSFTLRFALLASVVPVPAAVVAVVSPVGEDAAGVSTGGLPHAPSSAPTGGPAAAMPASLRNDLRSICRRRYEPPEKGQFPAGFVRMTFRTPHPRR